MRSLVATLAAVVGIISLLSLVLVPGAARLGLLSPLGAFTIFGGTLFFGMLLSLILGVIALVRTRARTGLAGRQRAWLGTLVGLGMLGLIATFALVLPRSSIPDVTTNIADPPEFSHVLAVIVFPVPTTLYQTPGAVMLVPQFGTVTGSVTAAVHTLLDTPRSDNGPGG